MFATLRQRNFLLLFSGQIISSIGDWVLWIALPFYVYEQTGSALATGAMFIVNNLPTLLFGSLAGVFVDRWDRRRIMIGTDLLRALLLLFLLLARSSQTIWLVYPTAFLISFMAQFFRPAKQAIIPSLVKQEHLLSANTLNSIGGDLAMLAGPALGGLLFGWFGFTGVVLIDLASFLLSALLVYGITVPTQSLPLTDEKATTVPGTPWFQIWRDWRTGIQLMQENRTITAIFVFVSLDYVGNGIILVLWAIYVKTNLNGGPLEYGWIQVAVAVGGLVGGFLLTRMQKRFSPRWLISSSGYIVGLLLLATFHYPSLPVILSLQLGVGIAAVAFGVTTETLLQTSAAEQYLGRIFGAHHTTNALAVLIGQMLGSALADRVGIVPMLDLAAAFTLISGVAAWFMLPTHDRHP